MKSIELGIPVVEEGIFEGDKKNIIYGAGQHGKSIYRYLQTMGANIYAFYDDDPTKWGNEIHGTPIISKAEFCMENQIGGVQ